MQPMTATFQRCSHDIENFDVVRLENGEMAIRLRPGQSPDRLPSWKADVSWAHSSAEESRSYGDDND